MYGLSSRSVGLTMYGLSSRSMLSGTIAGSMLSGTIAGSMRLQLGNDFGFLTRGLHVVKSSLTDSGIFRSSGMYSESFNGLRCPERPLEVLAVLKHVGAVETELRRPLALLLLRFVVRVVAILLLGPLLSTIRRPLEFLLAILEPHSLSSHHRRWIRWQNAFCGVARPRPPVRRLNGTLDGIESYI